MGGKFYNDVWVNGGREMAHEIIKKSEKDTHDARAKAKQAEEAAERERRIGICRRFETGGSLSRRVSVLRAPAQMGRARGRARRGERRGGRSRA
jgi:hypothetical protein